jgi:ubiquinone/menaquinone biosynthesis C-methylase UbiE
MTTDYSRAVSTAREYYNSEDADTFYQTVWGGEDIHIGLYQHDDEPIRDASRRTVERMASKLTNLNADSHVLDIGAGYGGSARHLARECGCKVVCLNLSEVENDRNRDMNREQQLDDRIEVIDGSFEDIPLGDDEFDIVWSQDAILHSGDRTRVLGEARRVIKPGGEFIFTDPMQTDTCPEGVLQPILDRIRLQTLASPSFYREELSRLGFTELSFDDHTEQLARHYSRVLAETERREADLRRLISREYIDRMKTGLQHWIDGGHNGYLCWGIFHFRSP